MLVQFSVKNFRSIREQMVLSMLATKRRSRVPGLDLGATFSGFDEIKLLKCAAIYGANASGKSNIVSALSFFREFVLNSSKESQVDEPIKVEPFALANASNEDASAFEITFIKDGYLYQYGFEADHERVRSEFLKRKKENSKRVGIMFERIGDVIKIESPFKEEGRGLDKKTRGNALFLSVCANFDGAISSEVLRWFQNLKVVSGLRDEMLLPYTVKCLEDPLKGKKLTELLSKFDLGFERLEVREKAVPVLPSDIPDELKGLFEELNKLQKKNGGKTKELVSVHYSRDEDGSNAKEVHFDFSQESEGTRKIVALAGPLLDAIETSKVLIIDEFDARLHPVITRTIVDLFNSEDSNSSNAQLIVASHDTNLLDNELLRRDQIWFVEKDRKGSSHLTSLEEFKIRNDASFEKDYISGKYGAIPFVGNVKRLFGGGRNGEVVCRHDVVSKDQ